MFQRSAQSGWGTSSDGDAWVETGTGTVSIASNEGVIVSHGVDTNMRLGTNNAADVELLVRFSINLGNDFVGIQGRFTASGGLTTCYKFLYYAGGVHINKSINGTNTADLSTAVTTVSYNTYYWLKFRIASTTLSGKIWQDGSSEPGSWTTTATDSSISGTGTARVALLGNTDTGSAGVHFDHFTATTLQNTYDIMMRARLTNNLDTKDIMMRARLAGPTTKDIKLRARLANPTQTSTKDVMLRARLAGAGVKDVMLRACLQEAVTALPALAASVLTAKISGTSYTVLEGSPTYGETLDGRSTCSFIVRDDTGTVHFRFRQKVILNHSVRGDIFTGYINTAQEENLPPNTTNTITVTCIDEHWIADKRAYEGTEFEDQNAGDIAAYLASQLAADGITSAYAIDHDTTISDFAEGTLSGVVAAASTSSTLTGDGDLELAPSGTTLTVTEQSTADFNNGTLSNTQANGAGPAGSGSLSLTSTPAIKMTGTASIPGGGNLYCYYKIWTGSQALATGYTLHYDVWIASTSPQIQAGVDMIMTDGTSMRDVSSQACKDQQFLPAHPGTDLSGFANDQWYSRTIKLDALNGKTTSYASIAFEGNNIGTYTAYFRNIYILDGSGNLLGGSPIFGSTLNVSPAQQLQNQGYTNVSVGVVTAYQQTGTRTSPAWDLSSVGIARASLISWQQTIPTDPNAKTSGAAYSLAVSASLDGGNTWQPCVNNQPIPGIMPGLLATGQTLTLLETLSNTTTDPTQTPALNSLQATIQPSYASIKRDVVTKTATSTDWNAGTFNAASLYNNGLTLDGYTRTWDSASLAGQTTFGGNSPNVYVYSRQCVLASGNNADARSRLDFAGQWQNFTAEVDILVGGISGTTQNGGLVYRTTGWQNNNDTYAYVAYVNQTQIALARGTNSSSGSGSVTTISTVSITLSSGNTHRLKVVVNGNNHTVYLDDVQYISVTDSTYTAAGYIGLRYFNNSGVTASINFNNFGVAAGTSVQRVSPGVDLSSAGTVQDTYISWNATTPGSSSLLVEASSPRRHHLADVQQRRGYRSSPGSPCYQPGNEYTTSPPAGHKPCRCAACLSA